MSPAAPSVRSSSTWSVLASLVLVFACSPPPPETPASPPSLDGEPAAASEGAGSQAGIDAISASATNGPLNRVYTAILLTLASPEFLAQK